MRCAAVVLATGLLALAACRGGDVEQAAHPVGASLSSDANAPAAGGGAEEAASIREELPAPAQSYNAREGRVLYMYYCATCHGEEGRGDGLNAYNLDPKPRDLAMADFQSQRTDDDIISIIRSGGGVAGLSTAMPPWGKTIEERKVRQIVEYLRTLHESPE